MLLNMKRILACLALVIGLFVTVWADNTITNLEHERFVRQAQAETSPTPSSPSPAAQTTSEIPPTLPTPTPTKGDFKKLKTKFNLADPVGEDYPIVFNIIVFVAVSLVLAVIAIAVAISTMDPGRDSLIYRVTSGQKSKKDN